MAPVLAIVWMVAGVVLKRIAARPRWGRLRRFRRPGRATLNSTNNRASIALRMAASTLRMSNTYLGAQFRRFRTKLGSPIAIKAMAAKLARLVYRT
jgi:hypothetical protein